jgi:flagellin-like protein
MKGVSAVIATILMLMIVIALAGMAYMYLIGMFTSRTGKTIDVTDAGCRAGAVAPGYYVSIKNLDVTTPINTSVDLTVRIDGTLTAFSGTCAMSYLQIPAGGTVNCDINIAGGAAGSFHKVRIIGPANTAEEPANC